MAMNKALKRIPCLARLRIVHTAILVAVLGGLILAPSYAGAWASDSAAILEKAASSKKLVLYAFVGNGWDDASMNLKKRVLSQRKFLTAMDEHYLLVELSVPVDSDNASDEVKELMEKYKVTIFPAMIVVDSEGKELDELRYALKPVKWYLKKFDRLASRHLPKKK